MIQPLIYGKPSQPSHLSQPGVEQACEGFCDGFGGDKKPSQSFEAICEGVTVVKVLHGIKGEKGFCLMTVTVERKAPDIEYRKHGINIVGSPPAVLVRGGDGIGAQLNTAHYRICIPAMRTGRWKVKEPILEIPAGKKGIRGPEGSMGSPGTGFNQI